MSSLKHNVFIWGYGVITKDKDLSKDDKKAIKDSKAKVHYNDEPKKPAKQENE